jgi:uncharacterized phage protein (TIGR02218 family)
MLPIVGSLESLLAQKKQRFAVCWTIERTDGTTLRFTDHDHDLVLDDGNTFKSAGGFNASARQRQPDLGVHNLELMGIVDSVEITDADLRAGRYRNAEITEQLVDWRYPFAGAFYSQHYWLSSLTYGNGRWDATVVGLSKWLKPSVGRLFRRTCDWTLGDLNCGVSLTTYTGTVVTVTTRNKFTASGTFTTQVDDWFQYGQLQWSSGPNNQLKFDVKHSVQSTGTLITWLSCPFNIVVGNTFSIVPGCDHNFSTGCGTKFNNQERFGGFPYIPGTDRLYLTPDAKG